MNTIDPAEREQRPSLIRMLALLLRRWRLLVALPLAAGAAAIVVSLILPERYTVETRFTPERGGGEMPSQLLGLASQFGINLGSIGGDSEPLDFYAELLESQELLRTAALTTYRFRPKGDDEPMSGTMIDLLDIEEDTPEEDVFETVELLDDLILVRADHGAGIISAEVSAPWPELSVLLAERLLELVNEFNLERRQTRASAERSFLEGRVEEVGSQLRTAESELERFLLENRRFNDPQLELQEERLQRQVLLSQQLYTALVQSLEQARLGEVRNTPVITVLDRPRLPAERTAPGYLLNTALGLFLGALLAFAIVISGDLVRYSRASHPEEFADLEAAARDSFGGLRRRRR